MLYHSEFAVGATYTTAVKCRHSYQNTKIYPMYRVTQKVSRDRNINNSY